MPRREMEVRFADYTETGIDSQRHPVGEIRVCVEYARKSGWRSNSTRVFERVDRRDHRNWKESKYRAVAPWDMREEFDKWIQDLLDEGEA
jgi:hypothetical protein